MQSPLMPKRIGPWLVAAALLMLSRAALADLMLYPTRVVFEKNQRAAQVELINQGKTPETYRINLINRRMSETGEFIAVETPGAGEQFADRLLRYSPRQVTIPPGGSQTVRILLRKPADLSAGEYRSHLQFDRLADASGSGSIEELDQTFGGSSIGVVLTALVGASIPIIVRHGDTRASVTLSDLALVGPGADSQTLAFQINRDGSRSVFGDLAVTFTPEGGAAIELAKAGGVAVYVPNPLRRARMPLQLPAGTALRAGTLRVSFRDRPEAGGKLLAEASLALP